MTAVRLQDIVKRDRRDAERADAPMQAAADAAQLDTTRLGIDAAFAAAVAIVDAKWR